MEGKFKLTIDLGNDAMSERSDLVDALGKVMVRILDGSSTEGSVVDRNGNTVGSWEMPRDRKVQAQRFDGDHSPEDFEKARRMEDTGRY